MSTKSLSPLSFSPSVTQLVLKFYSIVHILYIERIVGGVDVRRSPR